MPAQNSVLVAEAKKELLQLEQRAVALRMLILAYDESVPAGIPIASDPKPAVVSVRRVGSRAPVGYFRAAALKLFEGGAVLTAAKVRATLQASGYKYALTSNHVSRQLAEMVEGGDITSKPNGAYTTYKLAKAKRNA
jgi:hypothetical protein